MSIIEAIRAFISTYERKLEYALMSIILALTFYLAWHIQTWRFAARDADRLQSSIDGHLAGERKSNTIGMNLETGLNDYRPAAQEIDRKVNHATSLDTGNRFDSGSVQRTAERIAAGEAARKRAQ